MRHKEWDRHTMTCMWGMWVHVQLSDLSTHAMVGQASRKTAAGGLTPSRRPACETGNGCGAICPRPCLLLARW